MKRCAKCHKYYANKFDTCSCGGMLIPTSKNEKIDVIVTEYIPKSPEYTVKCPTCGYTNIKRISTTEKVVSTVALGIFSNKRRQQFECLNPKCRYKW
jgi:hypothetical protein